MRIQKLFFILALVSALSFTAHANSNSFEACQKRGAELLDEFKRYGEKLEGDNLSACIKNLVQLNSGVNHVKAKDSCGFICWGNKKAAKHFGGPEKYLKELEKETTTEMVEMIEKEAGKSLEDVVNDSYHYYAVLNKEKTKKMDGYAVFNGILLDTIKLYINAEVAEMGLEKALGLNDKITQIESEISECLLNIKSKQGIKMCVSKFQLNAVFKIGEMALALNLEKHFQKEVSTENFKLLKKEAFNEYNECSINHHFNPIASSDSVTDKIKACVFSGVLEAFYNATKIVISEKSSLSPKKVERIVKDLVSTCGETNYLKMNKSDKYSALQKVSQDSYVDYLLACKSSIKKGAISKIGAQSIETHPAVVSILGTERAGSFAKSIMSEGLPECIKKINNKKQTEKCENYLFAKTASKIFPIVLNEKFQDFKSSLPFLTDELAEKSISSSLSSINNCNDNNQKNFEAFLNLSEKDAEKLISKCIKSAILSSLHEITQAYLESEISKNKILIKYRIEFGSRKKNDLRNHFQQCANNNISTSNGLTSVVDSSDKFLEICILKVMKKVILETINIIVEKELRKIGVPFSNTEKIINDYKKKDYNVFKEVEKAESIDRLDIILAYADKKLIKDISSPIIMFLINTKSPVKFSTDVLNKLVQKGKSSLVSCIQTKSSDQCTTLVENEVMALGIELYMHVILEEKLTSYRKNYPFLTNGLIKLSTKEAKTELSNCFAWFKKSTKEISVERRAAVCAKKTILKAMDSVVNSYINTEVTKNKTLKKYKINISPQEKINLKNLFKICANKNISTKNALTSVLKDSETFLSKCSGQIMKKVALSKLDVILKKELHSIGVSAAHANTIIQDYRKKKVNVFSIIRQTNLKNLDRTLNTLDKKVAVDLANDIFKVLISAKSPVKFSPSQMEKLVRKGTNSLKTCVKRKTVSECSKIAEKDVTIHAIQIYFPLAVSNEFQESLSKWVSPQQFKSLKIYELISKAISQKEGYQVAQAVVNAFNSGASMTAVKSLSAARVFIANTILSSQWRVDALANFIIQKELDNFIQNPKDFKTRFGLKVFYNSGRGPAFKWVNIKENRSGIKVMALFKMYLRKIVASNYTLTPADHKKLEQLVYKAVQDYYTPESQDYTQPKVTKKNQWFSYGLSKSQTISNQKYQVLHSRMLNNVNSVSAIDKKLYYTYLYVRNCLNNPNSSVSIKHCPSLNTKVEKWYNG